MPPNVSGGQGGHRRRPDGDIVMKVLIVEDDRALGLFLQKGLKLEGHDTAWVEDGEAALAYAEVQEPDLVVLDLGLPRLDGTAVLERLMVGGSKPAVIILTGRNDVDERIRCLNLGADDFLMKPFSFYELAARCRAILRRQSGSASTQLHSGDLRMDLLHRKVEHCGVALELTPKEFGLLECLLKSKGDCCTREALLREVWHVRAEASANVVDVYVNYLRKKLAATTAQGEGANLIETVRGVGYRIVARECGTADIKHSRSNMFLARGA